MDSTCLVMWAMEEMGKARGDDGSVLFSASTLRAVAQKVLEGILVCNYLGLEFRGLNLWFSS